MNPVCSFYVQTRGGLCSSQTLNFVSVRKVIYEMEDQVMFFGHMVPRLTDVKSESILALSRAVPVCDEIASNIERQFRGQKILVVLIKILLLVHVKKPRVNLESIVSV